MRHAIVPGLLRWILAVAVCLPLLVAACGSGGGAAPGGTPSPSVSVSPSPQAPAPNAALCADAAALRASLDKLTRVEAGPGAASEITADLRDVQRKLTALVDRAHGQWQEQISALTSALSRLRTAVANLASNPTASAVSDVAGALGDVDTAAQDLLAAVNTRCPSASPSSGT